MGVFGLEPMTWELSLRRHAPQKSLHAWDRPGARIILYRMPNQVDPHGLYRYEKELSGRQDPKCL